MEKKKQNFQAQSGTHPRERNPKWIKTQTINKIGWVTINTHNQRISNSTFFLISLLEIT